METRKAALAGSWYPATAAECEREIREFMAHPGSETVSEGPFVGGIVPHAGWYYSGRIACNVIARLSEGGPADAVAIFGLHLAPGMPNTIMAQGAWETPFGDLPVEEKLAAALCERFAFQVETPTRHMRDNTIELQLPFVRHFFPQTRIVPIGVPPDPASLEIGRALVEAARLQGKVLRVLGSTDLTHYGANYGFSPQGRGPAALEWVCNENDRRVIEAMLALDPEAVIREGLTHHNACCAGAAAAAIAAGRLLGARKAESVAYATSYDRSPGDSFVGYVGVVF